MSSASVEKIAALLDADRSNVPALMEVTGLCADSRRVKPGNVFVAVTGGSNDGHRFVADAFKSGATLAVVSERSALGDLPGLVVPDTRRALSKMAAFFNGFPSESLKTVAITGTNGKTTINWLLYHALNALGYACVRIGTLGVKADGILDRPGDLTTPDPILIQRDLKTAYEAGCRSAVLETSSHALAQARVEDVAFDVGIFTNLTRDHLDYHGSMENYFAAKQHLFELIAKGSKATRAAVVNVDDDSGRVLHAKSAAWGLRDFSFGSSDKAAFRITSFRQDFSGSETELSIEGKRVRLRTGLIGAHNAQNLAATLAGLCALGIDVPAACDAIEHSPQVPGRLEAITGAPFGVFVDYAHTPDALENTLNALRGLKPRALWAVFGCGGDRDRGKRPLMAAVAVQKADKVIVTSDNPRTEDPNAIISDILSKGAAISSIEVDRRKAIEQALRQAGAGDIVLIAGKGHEDYQIIGTEKVHFSDQEVARNTVRSLGYSA